jgi:hypothetical protein
LRAQSPISIEQVGKNSQHQVERNLSGAGESKSRLFNGVV